MPFKTESSQVSVWADFISEYMPSANGEYVKLYLYGLYGASQGKSLTDEELASLFHILVTDVENAWSYWEKVGLMERKGEDKVFVFPKKKDDSLSAKENQAERPPKISAGEVMREMKINSAMKDTVSMAEQLLERPLSSREITSIYDFMNWYGMDGNLVLMLLEYCVSMDKKNFAYIEKVAQSWHREGINDIKSAEAVIKRANEEKKFAGRCMKIFGLERNFSASELKYINSWKSDFGFSAAMVECAYDITVKNTGKAAFAYMNKILSSWHQKGIKTPADIKEKDAAPVKGQKMDEQALIEMRRRMEQEG